MDLNDQKITIIGAGIGGLAAGIALSQKGAKVTIIEQSDDLGEVGAGLQISPNGVAVLEALGIRAEAAKLANEPENVILRDYKGSTVATLPLGDTSVARYKRPYWQFHRADLLSVLAEGAKKAGVEILFGHKVTNVVANQAGTLIEFEDTPEYLADVLIAADGVRSPTRTAMFEGEPATFTGQVAWRGLVPADRLPKGLFPNAATVFMGKGRHLVAYPLRGGSVINFVAVEERASWTDEGWNVPDSADNLRAAFKGWCEPVEKLLAEVEHTFLWGLFNHPVLPRWASHNVALLGDSCHPMLPFLAQGAVMGLEDAWVLADALEKADDVRAGLRDYEARRKDRATKVQNAALRNARAYHLKNPLVRGVAHKVLSHLNADTLLDRFDWLYAEDVTKPET